jgi:hypothetical protein
VAGCTLLTPLLVQLLLPQRQEHPMALILWLDLGKLLMKSIHCSCFDHHICNHSA